MPSKRGSRNSAATPAQFSREQEGDDCAEEDSGMEIDDGTGQLRRNEENLKKSMAIDVGLRKGQRQERLEKEFEAQFRELEAQIDERVRKHQQDTKRIHEDFVTRLLALTERKAAVEKKIIQAVQELAKAQEMIQEEFEAILNGRSADVREAMAALRETQREANERPN